MPSLQKWLGDTMNVVFSKMVHPVSVTKSEYLNERLKRVRFEGDLSGTKFKSGNVVAFRVTPNDFRHYTPSYYNESKGICEIIFYLHGKGVGSQWAEELSPGYSSRFIGPGRRLSYSLQSSNHFIFGDETSLGLMSCMHAEAERNNHSFFALMETGSTNRHWNSFFPSIPAVYITSSIEYPAKSGILFFEQLDDWLVAMEHTAFYLTGRAKSILAVRKYLLSKGVSNK
ncbi:MAG: siderophore-interacting protein [Agriterribacter sp.]